MNERAAFAQNTLTIRGSALTTADVASAARRSGTQMEIDSSCMDKVRASRRTLEQLIDDGRVVYGVNTSMGGFVSYLVPGQFAAEMQANLIAAVATNVGAYFDDDVVRATMVARVNSLARGRSAITEDNLRKYVDVFNAGVCPCVPSKGSLGTSGDLGPLAAIALACSGKWKARLHGELMAGAQALEMAGLEPMQLGFKEGLALINGTSAMTGLACLIVEDALTLVRTYQSISAITFEVLKAKKKALSPVVHAEKPHVGQARIAAEILRLLEGSTLAADEEDVGRKLRQQLDGDIKSADDQIEDAYSIRCTPQILGPVLDTLLFVKQTVERELNSSNDNPLVIPEHGDAFHNGHFHGQYIAMAMDQLSIAMTTLGNLSDRRIDRYMDSNHSNGLPPFLCKEKPGLRLGLMGGQFMSASIASENRSLCTPVSTQSLPSTEDFQDIVSLGLVAARRAREILDNCCYIVAFELLCACQAADIRGVDGLSAHAKKIYNVIRADVPYLDRDECMTDYLEAIVRKIRSAEIANLLEH